MQDFILWKKTSTTFRYLAQISAQVLTFLSRMILKQQSLKNTYKIIQGEKVKLFEYIEQIDIKINQMLMKVR